MNQQNRLEIISQPGWRREWPLTKDIIYIGSAVTCDIVLDEHFGGGVAPLQVQLVAAAAQNGAYKLINVGHTPITVGEAQLGPQSIVVLTDGLQFKLGEFTLVFHGGDQPGAGAAHKSRSIGLKLEMPSIQMTPLQSLEGIVTVSNLGRRVGARFDLTLEGMEAGCYDIAPGPLLSSGAEKGVIFRLHHLGNQPLAGKRRIIIRAVSPETYPGEQATVSQVIEVLPYHRHRLNLAPARGITLSQISVPETAHRQPGKETAWDLRARPAAPPTVTLKAAEPRQPAQYPPPAAQIDLAASPAPVSIDQTPTAPKLPAQSRPDVPEQLIDLAAQPRLKAAKPASAGSGWSDELQTKTTNPGAPPQKIRATVLPQPSAPSLAEKGSDW